MESEYFIDPFREIWFVIVGAECKSINRHRTLTRILKLTESAKNMCKLDQDAAVRTVEIVEFKTFTSTTTKEQKNN